jgi:leucyl aminopeptidase (aminopeptidase T)
VILSKKSMNEKVLRTVTSLTKLRDLDEKEREVGQNVLKNCLAVKKDEKVLIITDRGKVEVEAPIFFEAAKFFTDQAELIEMSPTGVSGQEPPEEVSEKMLHCDVAILVTSFSLTHTLARKNATTKGSRIASLPGITREIILRTLGLDYTKIGADAKKLAGFLTSGDKAHLSSPNGTRISFSLEGRDAIADTGLLTDTGDFGNLPAGEAFLAPKEGETKGTLVFDGGFADMFLDEPIKLVVQKGKAVRIEGGQAALQLERLLATIGEKGYNIAELGAGTNPACQLGSSALEVEKVRGTVHVALGNNATIGGEVDVPYHGDGIILKPTLIIDDREIIKDGKILV